MRTGQEAKELLDVKIFSPREIFYEGKAIAVSAKNKTGNFDVLAYHHNFISLIEEGDVTVTTESNQRIKVSLRPSLMRVVNNTVTVFADV